MKTSVESDLTEQPGETAGGGEARAAMEGPPGAGAPPGAGGSDTSHPLADEALEGVADTGLSGLEVGIGVGGMSTLIQPNDSELEP